MEQPANNEYERARWWRRNTVKLTVEELAAATGYTTEAIYLMERGCNSRGKKVRDWVWQRYKNACAAVQYAQGFDWK